MPTLDSTSLDHLDRESLKNIGKELEKHFPRTLEETELVLLEVSPHRLHAYWHITPWDLDTVLAKTRHNQARLVMRFHDLSGETPATIRHPWFDLELTETSGSRYVELWQDAKRYRAELGMRIGDGQLLDLARSNVVELPRASQSPFAGSRVLTLTPQADRLYQAPFDINQGELGSQGRSWGENPDQPIDLTLFDSGVELYPEFPNPLHPEEVKQRLRLPRYQRLQAIEISPGPGHAQRSGKKPSDGSLASISPLLMHREFPLSPIDVLDWDQTLDQPTAMLNWPSSPLPPWPDELPTPRPTTAAGTTLTTSATSFPGSSALPLSSFELGGQAQAEPDMELHMELHIRGRKPPDGPFILSGQVIPTDEQGNFSLTRVLPPETQQLVAQLLAAIRVH